MLGHWYTLLLLQPPATGPREVWRGSSAICTSVAGHSAITTQIAALAAPGPITSSLNGQIIPPGTILWQAEVGDGEYPLVLAQNEGLSIRSVAVPATGTWTATVDIQWAEVSAY